MRAVSLAGGVLCCAIWLAGCNSAVREPVQPSIAVAEFGAAAVFMHGGDTFSRPIVEVEVNGIMCRFLVDTGASWIGMTESGVERVGLTISSSRRWRVRAGDGSYAWVPTVGPLELVLGGTRMHCEDIPVLPLEEVHGLIGSELLRLLDGRIDFATHHLYLERSE